MKWTLIIIGIIVCVILLMIIIGYTLPVKHIAAVKVGLDAPRDKVWERLTNFKDYPTWRKNLKAVEVRSTDEWLEITNNNKSLPLKISIAETGHRFSTVIDGRNLPFGGTWNFELADSAYQTIVSITENGEVYNPFFRFVSRFIIGHSRTLNEYAGFLEQSFK